MAKSKVDSAAYALLSEYMSLYWDKYGSNPLINKYKEKWAMASLVEDFGQEEVRETLVYYFKLTKDRHPLPWFFNNFVAVHTSRLSAQKDDILRAEQRKKTQELRSEYINGVS